MKDTKYPISLLTTQLKYPEKIALIPNTQNPQSGLKSALLKKSIRIMEVVSVLWSVYCIWIRLATILDKTLRVRNVFAILLFW